ncbi:MAG: flagellar motor protein MotB [Pseudomonadota bacterium]
MDERPIIIKKVVKGGGDGHHGGAWKVAYADFVTAMMAFFLLMWLLNATSEEQRKGLADFFDPALPISRASAGGAGMLNGDTMFTPEPAAGSRTEGIRARPTHEEEGEDLGDKEASPDLPEAETAPNTLPGGLDGDGTQMAARPEGAPDDAQDDPDSAALAQAPPGFDTDQAGLGEAKDIAVDLLAQVNAAGGDGLLEHFSMRMTPEGLVIEIVDIQDSPLFPSGASQPEPILDVLSDILVPVLNRTTNDIAVVGHTDARPFTGRQDYSNWELSSDRANAARRVLADRGLPENRIVRVSGKAATDPIAGDPNAPQNRRIAITLLKN